MNNVSRRERTDDEINEKLSDPRERNKKTKIMY